MKRVISLVMAGIMCFMLVGCNSGKNNDEASNAKSGGNSLISNSKSYDDDYSGAYNKATEIVDVLTEQVDGILEKYNIAIEEADPDNYYTNPEYLGSMLFMPLMSIDLAFTATFNEKDIDSTITGIKLMFEMFGNKNVEVTRKAAHDYFIKYDGTAYTEDYQTVDATYELYAKYNPSNKGLRYYELKAVSGGSKEPDSFYEYIPLGGDKYAYQMGGQRAIITYKDNEVKEFVYSQLKDGKYDYIKDSIYPNKSVDEAWVTANGNFSQLLKFNGNKLEVSSVKFDGTMNNVTINVD